MEKRETVSRKFRLGKYLTIAMIVAGGFILIYPFYPMIEYRLGWLDTGSLADSKLPEADDIDPNKNILIIQKIGVKVPIVEGENESALNRGAWHIPDTAYPDSGGNTVISAHRFQFLPPNNKTFYLLDKLDLNDKIAIFWRGVKHEYIISKIFEVDNNDLSIHENTDNEQITLYTCTPLFSTARRLVIIGQPAS